MIDASRPKVILPVIAIRGFCRQVIIIIIIIIIITRISGRIIRHNYLNDIIHRSLNHAGIPATKEPQGLSRSHSKRPDGLILTLWREGLCLIWDITIADITAICYLPTTAITAGNAAELAATRKLVKYEDLSQGYAFVPIAIESHGTFSKSALNFLHELELCATTVTLDPRETSFLFQHLSIVIQRFKCCLFCLHFCHQLTANFFKKSLYLMLIL